MREIDDLRGMNTVVQAQYDKAQQAFQQIVAQESKIRQELVQLSDMATSARERVSLDDGMQMIGADLIWQSWLARKRRELNMQLARTLALKEPHVASVRRCYGKLIATRALITDLETKEKRRNVNATLDLAIAQSVQQKFQ